MANFVCYLHRKYILGNIEDDEIFTNLTIVHQKYTDYASCTTQIKNCPKTNVLWLWKFWISNKQDTYKIHLHKLHKLVDFFA